MAVVIDGEPVPAEYRHYRVRTVLGSDDYAALREVLSRRLKRGIATGSLPDLILIDGGRGQLGVLETLLAELGLSQVVAAAALAKSRVKANVRGRAVERSEERLFLSGRKNPVSLPQGAPALFLLSRLRDEAHRFAITAHRKLRSRTQLTSLLGTISGIGPQRRRLLLRHFGSIVRLRQASLAELQALPGLPKGVVERLHAQLHGAAEPDEQPSS